MTNSYETTSIEVASYLAATGFIYKVTPRPDKRALFCFGDTPELRSAIVEFEKGGFPKRLLSARSRLYREASAAVRRGRETAHRKLPPHVIAELERRAAESASAPFASRDFNLTMPDLIFEVLRIDREVQR